MHARQALPALTLGAIGVVFGDIGTSPIYALKEIFNGHHPIPVTPENVLGILSMVFWSIMALVSIKYVAVIMRADGVARAVAVAAGASTIIWTDRPGSPSSILMGRTTRPAR